MSIITPQLLLSLCYQKFSKISSLPVPFYDPSGNIFIQIDGISIGSHLGPTISKFYMSHLENKIFKTTITNPSYMSAMSIFSSQHTPTTKLTNSRKNCTKLYHQTQH